MAAFDDGTGPALPAPGLLTLRAPYREAMYRWRGGSFEPVVGLPYAMDSTVAFDGTSQGLLLTSGEAILGATFIRRCAAGAGRPTSTAMEKLGLTCDIEAFFACLSGTCSPAPCTSTADFNADGDVGTDADIDAFFRVLGAGPLRRRGWLTLV